MSSAGKVLEKVKKEKERRGWGRRRNLFAFPNALKPPE